MRAVPKVAVREATLDPGLAAAQPVEHRRHLVAGVRSEAEQVAEAGGRVLAPCTLAIISNRPQKFAHLAIRAQPSGVLACGGRVRQADVAAPDDLAPRRPVVLAVRTAAHGDDKARGEAEVFRSAEAPRSFAKSASIAISMSEKKNFAPSSGVSRPHSFRAASL